MYWFRFKWLKALKYDRYISIFFCRLLKHRTKFVLIFCRPIDLRLTVHEYNIHRPVECVYLKVYLIQLYFFYLSLFLIASTWALVVLGFTMYWYCLILNYTFCVKKCIKVISWTVSKSNFKV